LWAGRCIKTAPLDQRLRLLGVKMASLQTGEGDGSAGATPVQAGESLPLFDDVP
jgi:DNA polymerase-4